MKTCILLKTMPKVFKWREKFNQGYVSGPQERYELKGGRQKLGGK